MIKRLLITSPLVLVLVLIMQWGLVTPVYASTIQRGSQSLALSHSTAGFYALANLMGEKPFALQASSLAQPSYNSVRPINPGFTEIKPVNLRTVAINISGPDQIALTNPIILSGYLRDFFTGAGIANKTITISTDGFYLGQTHTNDQGLFNITINKVLHAGKYFVTATFKGAHQLAPASAAMWVEVLPSTVHIQTIPALAGITFQMAGRQFQSGPDGSATIQIEQAGQYRLDILLDKFNDPSQEVEFGRWSTESYQPSREVNVPGAGVIQVGINIYHKVSMKFVDLDGYPVDPARISSTSIRSVQGDVFTLNSGDTTWLPASRTARRQSGLEETDLLYSINSVLIDGSNVVNSAQQRFLARSDDTWTITLLLYSLNITVRDGLFASPIGKSIDVAFPNGQIKNYILDHSGNLQIHALARGIYHVSILGVKGLGTTTPVALSRNQVVKLKIVTRMDLVIVGMVSLCFALGLLVYGRLHLLKNFLRRKRSPSSRLEWIPKHEI